MARHRSEPSQVASNKQHLDADLVFKAKFYGKSLAVL